MVLDRWIAYADEDDGIVVCFVVARLFIPRLVELIAHRLVSV